MTPFQNVAEAHVLRKLVHFTLSESIQRRDMAFVVSYLMRSYGVDRDEVALLVLDRRADFLRFVAPGYLAVILAVIPFQPRTSLAGDALWTRKIRIDNRLPALNHLGYFEKVRRLNPRPFRIGKMLTVPIFNGSAPLGVVQITRKLVPGQSIGPDFKMEEAGHVIEIEGTVCRLLQSLRSPETRLPSRPEPGKLLRLVTEPLGSGAKRQDKASAGLL